MTSLIGAYGGKHDQVDHEKLIKDLRACNTDLIFLDNSLQFEAEMEKFCRETVAKFEDLNTTLCGEAHTLLKAAYSVCIRGRARGSFNVPLK